MRLRLTLQVKVMKEDRCVCHRPHEGGQGFRSWRSMRPTSAAGLFSRQVREIVRFNFH